MAQPFSEETQELLARAQRAIDRSIELCANTRRHIDEAERKMFSLVLTMAARQRHRAEK